jgi:hypothetical protein
MSHHTNEEEPAIATDGVVVPFNPVSLPLSDLGICWRRVLFRDRWMREAADRDARRHRVDKTGYLQASGGVACSAMRAEEKPPPK